MVLISLSSCRNFLVGHLIKGMDALPIEPSQHLNASVSLFPERRDELAEFFGRQILKIDLF
jgi:hypothetical protein